jgi:uncharacterized protein (TIGR02265 family)
VQQVKGSVLRSRMAFVEEVAGKPGVDRVLGLLGEQDRKDLGMILTVKWYPFELGKRLDDAIFQALGNGDAAFFLKLGEASAVKNLSTVHKSFLTTGDAHSFLGKAPLIYSMYYETGRREYERTGDRSGVLTTRDAQTFSAPDCLTVVGWHRKALEMCGVTAVQVIEEECRAKGGTVCRYRVSWS